MKSKPSVISPTSKLFRLDFAQAQGTTALVSDRNITIGSTSSLTYVTLHTATYTIDNIGTLTLAYVFIQIVTNNSANGECKIQISEDGGSTFVDMTGDIGAGSNLNTGGYGLWISGINIGANKLQLRVLGRSTDGASATIKIRNDFAGTNSFGELVIHKDL